MTPALQRGLAASRVESWLVIAVVFLAPMNYFRAPNIYITASDLAALLALAAFAFRRTLPLRFLGDTTSFWIAGVVLLQSGLLIGAFVNGDPAAGVVGFVQYAFSLILLPILICNRSFEETLGLFRVFVLSMTLVMLHGIYVAHFTPEDLRFMSVSGRLTSVIERENAAGALTAIAIVFSCFLVYIRQLSATAFVFCIVPLCYGLLLTGSNTGFILTVLGVLTLAAFTGSARLMASILTGGLIVVFAVVQFGEYFLPEIFVERVMGAVSSGDLNEAGTFTDRLYLIHEAIEIAQNTLIVGLGTDQYRVISAHGAPVHNTYLLLLTEGSMMSLAGLMVVMMAVVFVSWRAMQHPQTRLFGGVTICILIIYALAINGFAHVYARFWSVPLLLGVTLSASAVRAQRLRFGQPSPYRSFDRGRLIKGGRPV